MRTSLFLTLSGLLVQVFCLYEVTPGTFVIFALLSVPLTLAGLATYVFTVWQVLRRTKGL